MGKKYPLHDFSQMPTFTEIAMLKAEIESLRAKLPKWHRCDETDEDGFVDIPPESGCYFAQYETTWADGVTKRYCEPLEFDADDCDWPQLTNHCRVIQWCENPVPPEE